MPTKSLTPISSTYLQVLIKVHAVGVNPTDEKVSREAESAHQDVKLILPCALPSHQHASGLWGEGGQVVGCDAAGEVIHVGSAVKNVKAGDR